MIWSPEGSRWKSLTKVVIANKRLLVKCYDSKMVKLPSNLYYRVYSMQLNNKKKKKKLSENLPSLRFSDVTTDKWNNSEDVVFLKSRRRMWYLFVDRYSHICHIGTEMPDMVDLSDTTEHRTCNSIPSPPGNIASAPKHKDDRDCSSFTVHKKQKLKKMFWWLQDWEVWSQKILCISFLVIHHHVLASLHPSVGQSLCKSCNVRTYYTIFLSQTYYLEQLLTTTTPPINFPKLENIK